MEHSDIFSTNLAGRGFRVDQLRQDGVLTVLDARSVLASFMVDAMPDAALFRTSVGNVHSEHITRVVAALAK